MISALPAGFGSDAFFREMKQAWQKDDEKASQLLLTQVTLLCRSIIRKPGNGFYEVTKEDLEDYASEVWIKLWQNMDRFLSDPKNDPDSEGEHFTAAQKYEWARRLALHEMQHLRDRKFGRNPSGSGGQRIKILPLDISTGKNGNDTGYLDFIPSPDPAPEEQTVVSSAVSEALERLFSLPNNPETLAVVGYVILASALEEKRSAEEYADFLNRHTVDEIVGSMEDMMAANSLDASCLLPFRERIDKAGAGNTVPDITPKKLINRKNDIRSTLRGITIQE